MYASDCHAGFLTLSPDRPLGIYNYEYADTGTGSNTNNVLRRKGISFSEPLPYSRSQKVIKDVEHRSFLSQDKNSNRVVKKADKENKGLIEYLKEIQEMENIYWNYSSFLGKEDKSINLDCQLLKCSTPTLPPIDFYQTCFISGDSSSVLKSDDQISSPSYLSYTVDYPLNNSMESPILPPSIANLRDNEYLQPPKRKFLDCVGNFAESQYHNIKEVSIDTSSALSSETDSDFTFYPCNSPQFYDNLSMDKPGFSPTICELPSHLEDPDSPCPPYRQGYLRNSLEDVSREFYLEDDALSDDVFFDDYSIRSYDNESNCNNPPSNDIGLYRNSPLDTHLQTRLENVHIHDIPQNIDSYMNKNTRNTFVNESPRCSVAVERREEMLQSVTLIIKENETIEGDITSQYDLQTKSSNLKSPETRNVSESEDFNLSDYNLNLANAFDSLRKNSMQTKSRKLWKERRTRMKRSTLFNLKSTVSFPEEDGALNDNEQSPIISDTLPVDFKVKPQNNAIVTNPHDKSIKPLRGILKNKNVHYPTMPGIKSTPQYNEGNNNNHEYSSSLKKHYRTKQDVEELSHFDNQSKNGQSYDKCNYNHYSLDSRSASTGRIVRRFSRNFVSSPPMHRRFDRLRAKSRSPVLVSVGVQVNLIY